MAAPTFEVYKLLVEEVREARKARRDLSNVFMTANLAGVGALGFLGKEGGALHPALLGWCCFALFLTCVIWRMSNSYYTAMLSKKYDIIYEVERSIGYDYLKREWGTLPRKGPMRWFSFERAMPLMFMLGYVVFFAYQTTMAELDTMFREGWAPILRLLQSVGLN